MQQGDLAGAERWFRQAIARDPGYMPAHYNLGNVLRVQRRDDEALDSYRRANDLAPGDFDILVNLGVVLDSLARYPEAIACFEAASQVGPGRLEAPFNKAIALGRSGRHEKAIAVYDEIMGVAPENATVRYYRSLECLRLERWEEGFRDFEARLAAPGAVPHQLLAGKPAWDGRAMDGQTLLIYPENQVGDMIQFLRYVPLCKARGARVMVCSHQVLAPLLAAAPEIDRVVPDGSRLPESFDAYVSVLSLPALFGRRPELSPLRLNLRGEPALEIAGANGLKIGVCWKAEAGDPRRAGDSIADEVFWGVLGGLENVSFFSLQTGDSSRLHATPLAPRITDCLDEAVLVQQLDLVLTVDSSLAHLCGTLGVPTWILLGHSPDWRWGLNREMTDWYPSIRIFRQSEPGNWLSLLDAVAEAILAFNPGA